MNALKRILVMAVLTTVVFSLGFLSGCMTIKGAAADIEAGAGLVKRSIQPEYGK